MDKLYNLVLTGDALPGHRLEEVAPRLAQIMHVPETQAYNLLSGVETVIKRRLTSDQVPRYLQALGRAGVEARADAMDDMAKPGFASPRRHGDPLPRPNAPRAETPSEPPYPSSQHRGASPYGQHSPSLLYSADTAASLRAQSDPTPLSMVPDDRPPASDFTHVSRPNVPQPAEPARRLKRAGSRHEHDDDGATPPAFGFAMTGRIGRLRFLAYGIPSYVPLILGAVAMMMLKGLGLAALLAGTVAFLIMILRLVVLRLHDLNASGKWALLPFAISLLAVQGSVAGMLLSSGLVSLGYLALLLVPGDRGDNDYGPPPGPNTALVMIGAAISLIFMVASMASNPRQHLKLGNASPAPAEQVEED